MSIIVFLVARYRLIQSVDYYHIYRVIYIYTKSCWYHIQSDEAKNYESYLYLFDPKIVNYPKFRQLHKYRIVTSSSRGYTSDRDDMHDLGYICEDLVNSTVSISSIELVVS